MIVCYSVFTSVIFRTAIGDEGLVVLQPAFHRAAFIFHPSVQHGHVATIEAKTLPVRLQNLGCLNALGINHQPAGLTVQTMNHMGVTLEVAFLKILVQDSLHAELLGCGGHAQDARLFVHNDDILIFVNNLNPLVFQFGFTTMLAHAHNVARLQLIIILRHRLTIYGNSTAFQYVLQFVFTDAIKLFAKKIHEQHGLIHLIFVVFGSRILLAGHTSCHRFGCC